MKHSDPPRGGAKFVPRVTIWTNLVEDHKLMLHVIHETSAACGFREEDFFLYKSMKNMQNLNIQTLDPRGTATFDPGDFIWTNLIV